MNKFKLKNFLISISGFLVIDTFSLAFNYSLAEVKNKNSFEEKKSDYNFSSLNDFEISYEALKNEKSLSNYLINDLKHKDHQIFSLLASNSKKEKDNFSLEIVADIQYQDGTKSYAEGNAIIYFGDSVLRGDLITYDKDKKTILIEGNVRFNKGEQFFQASEVFIDIPKDSGFVNNVYGLIDSKTLTDDLNIEVNQNLNILEDDNNDMNYGVGDLKYKNASTFGLVNDFESDKRFNITNLDIKIPEVTRWRFKAEKINFNSNTFSSEKIFFTNDVFNKPQFVIRSKNFQGEIIENKLKLISRNTLLILDEKFKVPLGRRTIFDKDPITKWGLGADYSEKDGYFLFRGTESKKIFNDFAIKFQPYFLLQRAFQGSTKSFTAENSSIFSEKVKNNAKFTDYFALDINFRGKVNSWNIDSELKLNSLNLERLDQSLRSNITIQKRINLNKKKSVVNEEDKQEKNINIESLENKDKIYLGNNEDKSFNLKNKNLKLNSSEKDFTNYLDFNIYNIFREKVTKDFATEEIYLANGLSIANKKSWLINDKDSNLVLAYDIGKFKSKSRTKDEFKNLFRNVFMARYDYNFPIWKYKSEEDSINESYRYSPEVINQSINWQSGIQQSFYWYGDGSSQTVTKLNTGPVFTLGSLKKEFFDYTYFKADFIYALKGGESPFGFDNVNKDPRINFNFEQQIYGPIIFSYETSLNLEDGLYTKPNYGLDIKRRAYSIGAFYNSSNESLGIRFNIFNFDYSGVTPSF